MNSMNVSQLVFSPTGGTDKVAEIITKAWGMPVNKIDLSDAKIDYSSLCFKQEDVAVIAVPSYGGRVPGLAAERISNIRGNQTPCVIVCVYGNRAYEDTLVELSDIAEKSGFNIIAAIAAVAEHSIFHQYAAGRPDAEDESELNDFANQILDKVNGSPAAFSTPQIPGNRPYKKISVVSLVPKANNACTNCGLCAKQCPAMAISTEDFKATDTQKCLSCMRCVVNCPQSARKVNKAVVSSVALVIKKACSERKENELYL